MDDIIDSRAVRLPMHPPPVREVILTSGERLARDLRVDAALGMRQQGRRAWAAPKIHSFRRWTEREWQSCWPKEQILHSTQELALWLYAIEKSGAGDRQLSRMAAARQGRKIGNMVLTYGIDPDPGAFAGPEETLFAQWHELVMETVNERGWLLESRLPEALLALMDAGEWNPPARVRTVGMIYETPAQTALLDAMEARGTVVLRDAVTRPCESSVTLLRPVNAITQTRMAAERIRDLLVPFQKRVDQEPPRIALVVPDLNESRDAIDAALGEYLAPYTQVPGELRERRPWRYARGFPLADQPLMALALDLLALEQGRNPLDTLSRILLDPLVFPGADRSERAGFELRLRRMGYWFSLPRLQRLAAEQHDDDGFIGRFGQWLAIYETTRPVRGLPSEWAEWIQTILGAAGWGTGALTSVQTQVLESWAEALDVFRAMDSQIGEINASQMLVWVREILFARLFQAAVHHLQPVHVLSYADALGGVYDEIIVLDATAAVLPEVPRAPGLISTDRMAQAGVPGSTPDLALAEAEQWRDVLLQMAPRILVMAPAYDESGGTVTPSPVFNEWPVEASTGESSSDLTTLAGASGSALETPERDVVPAVEDPVSEGVRGGVAIFSSIAISPWVAFMRHRLGLSEFPVAAEGIESRDQGKLLHRVLERFWTETRTRDALVAIEANDLAEQIHELVGAVQLEDRLVSPEAFGEGLAKVERLRMTMLIVDWLEFEKLRTDPFEVVLTEAEVQTSVGGLDVSLRIDRVDRIDCADGNVRYVAIDYKSVSGAKVKRTKLEPPELDDPQLPIYAGFTDLSERGVPTLDGVVLAKIAESGCRFETTAGFCKNLIPAARGGNQGVADWEGLVREWRFLLERHAELFVNGSLTLDREKFRKARFQVDLAALARPESEAPISPAQGGPF